MAKREPSAAMRISQDTAMARPPPMHGPRIIAMVGFGALAMAAKAASVITRYLASSAGGGGGGGGWRVGGGGGPPAGGGRPGGPATCRATWRCAVRAR